MADAADFQGTSASPAHRWLRRPGALLTAAPLLVGLLQFSPPAIADAAGSSPASTADGFIASAVGQASGSAVASRHTQGLRKAEPTGSRTVDVAVNTLAPSAPVKGDTLTVSGTITNRSKHPVTDASVNLRVGPVLNGRTAIDTTSKGSSFGTVAEGTEIDGAYAQEYAKLAPGVPQTFSISVPVKKLDLGSNGVYQLGVALTGQTSAQPWSQVLGIERTFLPWQAKPAGTRIRTTALWPLISSTHLTAELGPDEQQTPVFHDDSLAKEIAPGGRLQQMLDLGSELNVTWILDPDLLASVDAMTRAYQVQRPDGSTVPGRNQAVAKQWLNDLEKAVAGTNVVALPFADPDLASLAHTGKNVSGSLSHLKGATDVAASAVETILHVKPDTDFAWPVNGAVDPAVVDVATSAGAHVVIARSDSLRETGDLPYTPSAARPVGGGTTAVVADAQLSTAFQGDMTGAETATLAVQKFLAQSLMIRQQAPDRQRSIVIAPQRMPTAYQAQAMAKALHALQDGNWSQSQDLAAAAKTDPDPGASTRLPSVRSYPSSLRKQETPQRDFEAIRNTQDKLDRFKGVLTDSSRVATPFGRAIDREMSTSWRGRPAHADAFRSGVAKYLDDLTTGVKLIDKSETKLSGRSATIPVTVQNNLVQGVDHLMLRLTSTRPTRLKIGDGPYYEQPVKVSGGHSQSVKFTTTANANGPVPVVAQLFTENGQPYGQAVMFDVDVNEITPTVMLVIAGGVLLLVLAGFRMYTQRKRAAARDAANGAASGSHSDGTDPATASEGPADMAEESSSGAPEADGPEQPSDPAPDTAPENTDVSGTGERVDR